MSAAGRATYLVAKREATERAKSRVFVVSTAVTLLMVAVSIVITALVSGSETTYRVVVAGENPPGVGQALVASAPDNASVEVATADDSDSALRAVANGDADGAIIGRDTIVVRSANSGIADLLTTALTQARLIERLGAGGLDPSVLLEAADITVQATDPTDDGASAVGFITVVLLFTVITIYGQWVLLGVLEEKSNRIVELLLSSTSVRSLLTGKIIGIGLLGLLQLAVLLLLGLGAAALVGTIDLPASTYPTAAWSVVWFILGFGFYAALFAAGGSLVARSEDAQAATTPVAMVGLVAYLVTFTVILPSPDSLTSRLLSLLPPIAPIAYPARLGLGVPAGELLLGVAMTVIGTVLVIRVAARIYAGGLLSSGGRVKLRQAWKAAGELAEG
ncbi:MAG: ABC transporter permease [Acidimicrobiia bacterium]